MSYNPWLQLNHQNDIPKNDIQETFETLIISAFDTFQWYNETIRAMTWLFLRMHLSILSTIKGQARRFLGNSLVIPEDFHGFLSLRIKHVLNQNCNKCPSLRLCKYCNRHWVALLSCITSWNVFDNLEDVWSGVSTFNPKPIAQTTMTST